MRPLEHEKLNKLQTGQKNIGQPSSFQEAIQQITLKDTWMNKQKWCISNPKSMEIDKLLSEMIVLLDFPLNFVEGIGFRRLVASHCAKLSDKGKA